MEQASPLFFFILFLSSTIRDCSRKLSLEVALVEELNYRSGDVAQVVRELA